MAHIIRPPVKHFFLYALILFCMGLVSPEESQETARGNIILAQVLKEEFKDGGYTIVEPRSCFAYYKKDLNIEKARILEQFSEYKEEISKLIDKFFVSNFTRSDLKIPSSPQNGYIIDKDKEEYRSDPRVHGHTAVSMPGYDENTSLVLVYKAIQRYPKLTTGFMILYRYKDCKLTELKRAAMWLF